MFRRPSARRPAVPEGLRVYAIGDVHGCFDLLVEMQRKIADDLARNPAERSVEIYVGDYVDRGTQSREVLDYLSDGNAVCDRRICLRGNHEEMLLAALNEPDRLAEWFQFGGRETLLSYGVAAPAFLTSANYAGARRAFCAAFPDRHRRFLAALPYSVAVGGYVFAHAGINPRRRLDDQSHEDLIWIREPFLSSEVAFERFVVHGHTPSEEPDVRPNRINIDTGAFLTGRLTCLVLEGETRAFIQATAC